MYHHTSKALKITANVLAVLGIVASIAIGLMLFGASGVKLLGHSVSAKTCRLAGVGVIAAGIVLSWVLGLLIHGFGELLEKTKDNNYLLSRIASHTKEMHEQQR